MEKNLHKTFHLQTLRNGVWHDRSHHTPEIKTHCLKNGVMFGYSLD